MVLVGCHNPGSAFMSFADVQTAGFESVTEDACIDDLKRQLQEKDIIVSALVVRPMWHICLDAIAVANQLLSGKARIWCKE